MMWRTASHSLLKGLNYALLARRVWRDYYRHSFARQHCADPSTAQQQQARSHVRAVGVDGEVWAEPGTGMGWRHSVPLALSALPIDRGGAQGAVGVNNRPKPKPAAPKGGTGPPGLSEASGLVLRRAQRCLWFFRVPQTDCRQAAKARRQSMTAHS